jgi:enoyl-CoA hydratase
LQERIDLDDGAISVLTLNRPNDRNPLDRSTLQVLRDIVVRLSSDGETRAIILTGAGSCFSAGGDLKGYQGLYRNPHEFRGFLQIFGEVCTALELSPALTVAMINGTCVAGGLELVLACDLITMSEEALVGDGHLRFGQLPGGGGSQRLVRAIGVQRARHWLLSGRLFDAAAATDAGLVVGTFPIDRLRSETLAVVGPLLKYSPLATKRMKELIHLATNTTLSEGVDKEWRVVHDYAVTSFDATEGLMAFAERRNPKYRGA